MRQARAIVVPFVENENLCLVLQTAKRGRMDDAIACFQRALDGAPELLTAHVGLGQALEAKGRYQEALNAYQRVLRVQPGVVEVLMSVGRIYAKLGVHSRHEAVARATQLELL